MPRDARVLIHLRGALDRAALRAAVEALVARHEVLHTSFERLPGMPEALQVAGDAAVHWEEVEQEEALRAAGAGALPSARLLRVGGDEHLLRLDVHALSVDSASFEHLARELAALYAAERGGEPVEDEPVPYLAVSEWLNDVGGSEEAQAGRAYWGRQSEGAEAVLPVERDAPVAAEPGDAWTGEPASLRRMLPAGASAALEELAARRGVAADTVLLAGWKALLHRLGGGESIRVAVASDGRADEELRHAVGPLTEHLPVTTSLRADLPFAELVDRLRDARDEAAGWQECYDRDAVRLLAGGGGGATPRLGFTVLPESGVHVGGGVEFAVSESRAGQDPFALHLRVAPRGAGVELELSGGDTFAPAQLGLLLERYETLLAGALARPEAPLGELPARSEAETARLLGEFSRTQARADAAERTIHALFEAQAARTPDGPALRFGGETVTYGELNARANRRARHLRSLGVGAETRVGIMLPSSVLRLETLLAVLKAGGAYVPLDPAYPHDRLAFMIGDAGLPLVLTGAALRDRVPAVEGAAVVAWDAVDDTVAALPDGNLDLPVDAASAAYVIYTSGSTGTPKGVLVEHRALAAHAAAVQAHYGLREGDRILQFASFNFDASVEQTLPPLASGACVVLREEAVSSVESLGRYVADGLTILNLPTAQWHLLADAWARDETVPDVSALRLVIAGGEAMLPHFVGRWRETPAREARLLNAYGPTEAVVTATTFDVPAGFGVDGEQRVPIGRPFGSRVAYVLDDTLDPVPIGVPGELYLGGATLARGYVGRAELTAGTFVPDPFSGGSGARLYRTGDRVRHQEDGTLVFLGRGDDQIKVRGFRIEPGEIETALGRHEVVQQCAVVLEEKGHGEKQLVAYWVPRGEPLIDGTGLRAYLLENLPDYMVPGVFVALEKMPLTAVGKVDRRRLPTERRIQAERPYVAPATPTEGQVAAIWGEVMRQERVSMDENFFAAGGHSLLATQLTSRLRKQFGIDLSIGRVFDAPTVAHLARTVEALVSGRAEAEDGGETIVRASREGQRMRASDLAALLDP